MNKKFIAIIIATMMCFQCVAYSAVDVVSSANDKKAEIAQENSQLQQDINKNSSQIANKEDEQSSLVAQVEQINNTIDETRGKILDLDQQMLEAGKTIEATNKIIADETQALRKRIRTIYMAGDASNLEIILGAKDFSDFIDKLELVKNISEYDSKLITQLQNSITKLEAEKEKLSASKTTQQEEQEQLNNSQQEFKTLVEQNKDTLGVLYDRYNSASDSLDENNSQLAAIENEIAQYYKNQKETATEKSTQLPDEAYDQPSASQTQDDNDGNGAADDNQDYSDDTKEDDEDPITPSGNGYIWPTPGFYNLTSLWNEDRGSYNHGALDIASGGISGARVVAAAAGTIAIASDTCTHNYGKDSSCGCGGGYGNWVMIDHGNGKATVYAHMESIAVVAGQSISAGQTIGYVGSTGDSTGAHLHFETRQDGVKYNPMTEYPSINITY